MCWGLSLGKDLEGDRAISKFVSFERERLSTKLAHHDASDTTNRLIRTALSVPGLSEGTEILEFGRLSCLSGAPAGSPILKIPSPLFPVPAPSKTPPGVVNGRGMRLLDVIGEVLHLGGQLLVSYVLVGLAYGWTLSSKPVQKYIPDDKVRKSCKTHALNSIFAHVVFIVLSLY